MKVAGLNECNQLCTESTAKGIYNTRVVSPPVNLTLDVSKLLSFSVYYEHSVWIDTKGNGYAIGFNRDFRISGSISNEIFRKKATIEIKDSDGNNRKLLSAVCGLYYTLYMVQPPISGGYPELAYVYHDLNNGKPLFLSTNNRKPICIFGGEENAAAVDSEGSVILITSTLCQIINLPNGLKAVSVAFCKKSVLILSKCNRLFECTYSKSKNHFSKLCEVSEFRKIDVVQISGTFEHCFAVLANGSVFGRGSNDYGKLGLSEKFVEASKFTRISALNSFVIKAAYAGSGHSIFQTSDGRILACGKNNNGQLLLNSGPSKNDSFIPTISDIDEKVSFCITGSGLSVVFTSDEIPPLIPNMRADDKSRMERKSTSPEHKIKDTKKDDEHSFDSKSKIDKKDTKKDEEHSFDSKSKIDKKVTKKDDEHSSHSKLKIDKKDMKKDEEHSFDSKLKIDKKETKKDDEHSSHLKLKISQGIYNKSPSELKSDNTEKLIKEIEKLKEMNNNLEGKIQTMSKQLKTASTNEIEYKKRIKALEQELESEKKKTKKQQPTSLNKLNHEQKFIDADSIRNYTRIKEIGRGATSEVIKVSKSEEYALKIFNSDICSKTVNEDDSDNDYDDLEKEPQFDIDKMRRFFNEYEIISQMNHPNIIKTFGFCFGDRLSRPSILLEFCPSNLNRCVKKLSQNERVSIIYEIAQAMKYIHSLGIIHRDLKPENILIDSQKHAKVSDFGISTLLTLETQTQSRTHGVGTLKFMAPELLRESGDYTEKVDVYAFGVVVFFVLTNGDFPKISVVEIGAGKMADIPDAVNNLSKKLIRKCWSNNADERPSFAEIVESIEKNKFKLIDGINQSNLHLFQYE